MTTNADQVELEGLLRLRYEEIAKLRAENERLKAALQNALMAWQEGRDINEEQVRAALEGKP